MDNDNKKSAGGKVQTDRQMTTKSGVTSSTPVTTQLPHPTHSKSGVNALNGYFTTEQVAKIIDVTKQAVIKWRKLGWFNADLVTHDGVYLYSPERVEQLKEVYRRDWQTAWRKNETADSEKKPVPEMFAFVEKQHVDWRRKAQPPKTLYLADYSTLVGKVKEGIRLGLSRRDAISRAVKFCLDNGLMKGYLEYNSQEVFNMLALEWNMDDALQARFEDGYEDGRNEGINIGIESVAFNLISMGMTVEKVQEATSLSRERIEELLANKFREAK